MSGRGKSKKVVDLIDASVHILAEIQPASIRAVCYQLFIRKLIPDMSKNSTSMVSHILARAREDGLLPWEWVVDETREAETISSWANPDRLIQSAVSQYRKDYWELQPRRVEIWSEKGTVRGTLAPVLKKFGTTFRVMHGYGSATALHAIARESVQNEKLLTALYVGDWDPSGMQMSEVDLPERLMRYGGCACILRIALNHEDVAKGTKLPWFEAESKVNDTRYAWFVERYGTRCWEVDALSPVVLRERMEKEIESLLDLDVWNHAIEIERVETESMQSFLKTYKSISGQAPKYSEGGAA